MEKYTKTTKELINNHKKREKLKKIKKNAENYTEKKKKISKK